MEIIHYDKQNLEELLKNDLVILDFYADWCGPCQMLSEDLEIIATERTAGLIVKINVDKHQNIATKYGVMSIPNIYIYKNNKELTHFVGYKSAEEINDLIKVNDN